MSRTRYQVFDSTFPYFLTCTVVEWIPLFNDPNLVELLFDSLRFMQNKNRLRIFAYVVMDTHIHLVASAENLSKEISNFKSFTARSIINNLKEKHHKKLLNQLAAAKAKHKKDRQYQVWQEGSHPQMIQNREVMEQKIEYIHFNPIRRGIVEKPTEWEYSSAANYENLPGLLEVNRDW
ncbi:MAG TPA: hypothetical protein VJ965_12715 [Anaerolineales bacterium]|nr:hypothetical protein [Anaerolineales bacterium]